MDKNADEINEAMHKIPGKITELRKELENASADKREKLEEKVTELEKQYEDATAKIEELEGATEQVWDGFHESLKKSVNEIDKGIKNIMDNLT